MMRAISVRHPWAWAILHGKPIENRGKPWPLGEYALHASRLPEPGKRGRPPLWFMEDWYAAKAMSGKAGLDWDSGPKLTYGILMEMSGAIIGTLDVTANVTSHPSPFYIPSKFGLVLANVRAITPIPCKGALGAWVVPPKIEAQVRAGGQGNG